MSNFTGLGCLCNILLSVCICFGFAEYSIADLAGAWDFEDGAPGGVTEDISGTLPAADATLSGPAVVIDDPLGIRGKVLDIPDGGKMSASEKPQMDVKKHSLITFWAYVPNDNAWWDLTLGKGGNGAPRFFIDTGSGSNQYVFVWATMVSESNGSLYDLSAGAYSTPLSRNSWHHIAAQIFPTQRDDGTGTMVDVIALVLYVDGAPVAEDNTLNYFQSGPNDLIYTTNASFDVAPNSNWQGYVDDIAFWDGYADDSVIQGLYDGTYTIFNAPVQKLTEDSYILPIGDFDKNGLVNLKDVKWLADRWMYDCLVLDCNDTDLVEDQIVNLSDFAVLSNNYRQGYGPTAKIERLYGVPTLTIDANWTTLPMYSNYHPYVQYLPVFEAAGIKIYDFPSSPAGWGVLSAWSGPVSWNYDILDMYFDRVIAADSDAMIIPRMYIGTPQWWLDDPCNTNEMELMDDGTGTSMYYSQYDTNPGILPRSGPFPSLASQKWREDMANAIEHYMDHLRLKGYMKNVIGFEISGLATEEWYHWSSNRSELAGYGSATVSAFREWLRNRYGDDLAAFRSAWNNPAVTFDNAPVPDYTDRNTYVYTRTWRDPANYMHVIDFLQFYNEIVPDTINYFAEVIKRNTENTKAVGAFYGYMYGFHADPGFGHNALQQFNESPFLDYVYATPSYSHRSLGGGDCYQGPAYSAQLHDKFWFVSDDTATVRTKDIFEYYKDYWGWSDQDVLNSLTNLGYTDTTEKNRWMLRRGAGLVVCNGMYKAFLDLHATDYASYYSHVDLMDEVALENSFFDRSKNYDRSSNSEILFVSDEFSCNYVASLDWWNGLLYTQLEMPRLAQIQLGAPADHILLNDLSLIDASRYKMAVFLNCYNMNDSQRSLVDSLKGDNRLLIFCYSPGYFNQNTYSTENMQSVCGMALDVSSSETLMPLRVRIETGEHPLAQILYDTGPENNIFGYAGNSAKRVWVNDINTKKLGKHYNTAIIGMAIREFTDWTSIYCATSNMPAAIYRELARYAGVHIYNESDDTLYANRSFLCIHASSAGSRTITFPQSVDVYDAFFETSLGTNTTTYTTSLSEGETLIIRYE